VGNRFAYEWADKVVVLGHDLSRRVIVEGVPPERVAVVPAWVDCDQIRLLESNPFRNEFSDKFVVMYSGNLGLSGYRARRLAREWFDRKVST
jgi:colanic acid biosynthesis glycosyl transferase WcaI